LNSLAGRELSAVRHPKDMGINGDSRYPKGGIQDHVGRLSTDPGEGLQGGAIAWHLATMPLQK
jgi:hypothetical protein